MTPLQTAHHPAWVQADWFSRLPSKRPPSVSPPTQPSQQRSGHSGRGLALGASALGVWLLHSLLSLGQLNKGLKTLLSASWLIAAKASAGRTEPPGGAEVRQVSWSKQATHPLAPLHYPTDVAQPGRTGALNCTQVCSGCSLEGQHAPPHCGDQAQCSWGRAFGACCCLCLYASLPRPRLPPVSSVPRRHAEAVL